MPIVKHVDSCVGEDDYCEDIKRGVCKANYYTYTANVGEDAISNKTYSQFQDALSDTEKSYA